MWSQAYSMGFAHGEFSPEKEVTALVTGGTSGIGLETARQLARMGARVVIVGRDGARTARVVESLRQTTGNRGIEMLLADLSSQEEIRRLAVHVREVCPRLTVLINNAGGMFSQRSVTSEGFERTWALNHLAYVLLTTEVLDLLKANAPSRIVNVASDMHRQGVIRFDDLHGEQRYGCLSAYQQSKLANVLFTRALARRLGGSGVTVNALHPGAVATGMGRDMTGLLWLVNRMLQFFFISPRKGATTPVYLAMSPEVDGVSGKYFVKCREVPATPAADDRNLQERLWEVSMAQCGLQERV